MVRSQMIFLSFSSEAHLTPSFSWSKSASTKDSSVYSLRSDWCLGVKGDFSVKNELKFLGRSTMPPQTGSSTQERQSRCVEGPTDSLRTSRRVCCVLVLLETCGGALWLDHLWYRHVRSKLSLPHPQQPILFLVLMNFSECHSLQINP